MRYDVVFFDCDGTLVDTEKMIVGLVREMCADRGCPVDELGAVVMVVGITWAATYHAIGDHLRAHGAEIDDQAVAAELHERLAPRHFDPGLVLPASVALLRRLARHVPVDVVSGSTTAQVERHLENCGLRDLVRHIVGDGMAAAGKPDPAPYLLAAAQAGVDPARCLAFEDSEAGVTSAVSAGMDVVALDRYGHVDLAACGAQLVVDDLGRLDAEELLANGLATGA